MLGYRIARSVLAILGLTNYGPFGSQAVHADAAARPQAGSPDSCAARYGFPAARPAGQLRIQLRAQLAV